MSESDDKTAQYRQMDDLRIAWAEADSLRAQLAVAQDIANKNFEAYQKATESYTEQVQKNERLYKRIKTSEEWTHACERHIKEGCEETKLRAEIEKLQEQARRNAVELISVLGQCEEHYYGERLEELLAAERKRCAVTVVNLPINSDVLAQAAEAILALPTLRQQAEDWAQYHNTVLRTYDAHEKPFDADDYTRPAKKK